MSPNLSFALTVLLWVIVGGITLRVIVWFIGAFFAARNIRRLQKNRMLRNFNQNR